MAEKPGRASRQRPIRTRAIVFEAFISANIGDRPQRGKISYVNVPGNDAGRGMIPGYNDLAPDIWATGPSAEGPTQPSTEKVAIEEERGEAAPTKVCFARAGYFAYQPVRANSTISSACCLLFGFKNIFRMIPFSSTRNVVRCNPIYLRPYSSFSPQTP